MNDNAFDYTAAFEIKGISTEFVCQKYENRVLLIITQYEKITNFYSVQNQVFQDPVIIGTHPTQIFDIKQRFGAPSIEIEGAIRYLMNFISQSKELLISLGLKNVEQIDRNLLDEIKNILMKIPIFNKNKK